MKILPKKEFERKVYDLYKGFGYSEEESAKEATSLEGIHVDETGEIWVLKGTPAGHRAHEVGHKVLGYSSEYPDPETGDRTLGDDILDELLAEKFSYEVRGKKPTYRMAIPAINMMVGEAGWSPETSVFWVTKIMRDKLKIGVTKSERRELARHAHGHSRRPRRQ